MLPKRKRIALTVLALMLLSVQAVFPVTSMEAAGANRVMVVHSTESGEIDQNVRLLDIVLGHFADDLEFRGAADLQAEDLKNVTHLVYYGATADQLPLAAKEAILSFDGPFLAIGENADQLRERLSTITHHGMVNIDRVTRKKGEAEAIVEYPFYIHHVTAAGEETGTVWTGWNGDQAHPLFIQHGRDAYYAANSLFGTSAYLLGQGLWTFFGKEPAGEHLAYVRLEDVHPFSDPELVRQSGQYLADKGIPFMIAVIPVYTHPETGKWHHLHENPALVRVLRDLQKAGGSIVLHGYTHQYRSTETGEGFEFWDVENNHPIAGAPDEDIQIKDRHDFATDGEYEQYVSSTRQYEEEYTRKRIEAGIHELFQLGLHPLAFEPPHYTMSQQGYEITADYFNLFLGQVQLTDENWQVMNSAPYPSKPAMLHGMTLLPETLGFYDVNLPDPLVPFRESIKTMLAIDDGVMGFFYHPYLGLEGLNRMIEEIEQVPGLKWIDLRQMSPLVQTDAVAVNSNEQGSLIVESSWSDRLSIFWETRGLFGFVQVLMWSIATVVAIMIALFLLYTIQMRLTLRKRLFKERNANG
ncbi:polysaccharide deacetylase family protein [Paenibacillus senegalensis]|uniref:polysaccharide deacetylase family protein n=1 Tax=Paenibacillus senegalensis TaxID=1465766 RepID=UPI000289F808|nr:polysaccharide deacetylase family protein [Paenibacillus senegalensis]